MPSITVTIPALRGDEPLHEASNSRMHGPSTSDLTAAPALFTWSDHNTRGLALASDGAWEEATAAFSDAADVLAGENDVASHEALALVLNNLAHCCYRAGRRDDAIAHAQRVCALRVALVGEDAIVVARARTDLAVMLSRTGRPDEAMSLVTRAIAGIERTAGDESLHLQYVLENAARLTMSAGQPSSAEPYLLRLHALLGAHDLPTDRAEALLARVSQHRAKARVSFGMLTPATHGSGVQDLSTDAVPEGVDEAEIPAAVADHAHIAADVEAHQTSAAEREDVVNNDVMPVSDAEVVAPVAPVAPVALKSLEELTLEDTTFEAKSPSTGLLGIEFELVELTPADSPALAAPAPVASVATSASNVLGFEVRYGTQTDEEAALTESMAPPVSVRVPTPQPTRVIPPSGPTQPQVATSAPSHAKPVVQGSTNASRATASADDHARERKIRLPKIRFR